MPIDSEFAEGSLKYSGYSNSGYSKMKFIKQKLLATAKLN